MQEHRAVAQAWCVPLNAAPPAARATQHAALDAFLRDVERRAFRIARVAIWDDEAALDIVQDSMLKLVEKYAARPAAEWPALFFTILKNRIRDMRRWRALRQHVERAATWLAAGGGEARELELADPRAITPESAAHSQQLRIRIDAALETLSFRQRQVFLLRERNGQDVRTTAQILGCSQGTVKQHHFRALRALRTELEEVWNDEHD